MLTRSLFVRICRLNAGKEKTRKSFASVVTASESGYFTEKTPITRQLWQKRQDHFAAEAAKGITPQNTTTTRELINKPPAFSRVDVKYDFANDNSLRTVYTDSFDNLLLEKFLEDLDALAGNVAFFHADDGLPETSPLALVTASVEEIKFFKNISIKENLVLSGQVVYVGRSSMDVLVEAHQYPSSSSSSSSSDGSSSAGGIDTNKQTPLLLDDSPSSNSTRVLTSLFTYVARDKSTGKSAQVNPLCTETMTDLEKIYNMKRQEIMILRKSEKAKSNTTSIASTSTSTKANTDVEAETEATKAMKLMISMVDHGKAMVDMPALCFRIRPHRVLMNSTVLENSFICQPQKTNTAGNVFGGFLLNRACSLAQSSIYMFSGQQAQCYLSLVNKIIFSNPVHIGDLIRLRSRISYVSNIYTDINTNYSDKQRHKQKQKHKQRYAVCDITCHIISPEHFKSIMSNRFSFVFTIDTDTDADIDIDTDTDIANVSMPLPMIQPSTKEEVLALFDASQNTLGLDIDTIASGYHQ